MSAAVHVRHAIADYLGNAGVALEGLHERVAQAFADAPVNSAEARVIDQAFGLMTDHQAGLLSLEELREALRLIVTSYSLSWPSMAPPVTAMTGASYAPASIGPNQRPSLRFFGKSPEAVSA